MFNIPRAQRAFNAYKQSGITSRVLIFVGNTNDKSYSGNQRMAAFAQWISLSPTSESDMAIVIHQGGIDYIKKHMSDTNTQELPEKNGSVRRFNDVAACIQASSSSPSVITVPREPALQKSDFAAKVVAAVGESALSEDAAAAALVSDILAVKDEVGLDYSKKSGALCTALIKRFLVPELEEIAANPESKRVEAFAEALNAKISKPNTISGLEQMSATYYATGYIEPPRVFAGESAQTLSLRSGGSLALLKLPQSVAGSFANAPSVALIFGAKHGGFATGIGRTFFIGQAPSAATKKAYKFLMALEQAVVKRLAAPGATFGEVYTGALDDVIKSGAATKELVAALPTDFGGVVGLHNHDPRLGINNDKGATTKVQPGMILVVRLALLPQDAKDAGADIGGNTPLVIANTYQVPLTANSPLVSLTRSTPSVEDSIVVAKETNKVEQAVEEEDAAAAPVKRIITTRAEKGLMPDMSAEQNRIATLKAILKKKHDAWVAAGRPRGGTDASASDEFRIFELGRLGTGLTVAYPGLDAAPSQYTQLRNDVALDRSKMALWLPLHGPSAPLTPIHVSAISKAEMRSAGQQEHYFTVTFHSTQEGNLAFRANRTKVFVRETTFCGPDSGKFYQITNGIKELQATIKAKDVERKAKQGVVAQAGLKMSNSPDRLPQVKCRPPPAVGRAVGARGSGAAGCEGCLEAHDNGFRFSYSGGFIDILYDNVKFMIVQPSKNDILVIFHLALRSAVLVGTKKTEHIQFIAEVMEGTVAVTSTRMSYEEENAREERDAERVRKTNMQFAQYAKKVSERSGLPVENPFSNVNFEGSATRGTVNFRGNQRCLWSIIEFPFFVMSMENVEVVALERVIAGNINFDMAFVHKDYRTVQNITTVPMGDLEKVKDWLLRTETIFFEVTVNIGWPAMLKQIRDDPDWVPFSEKAGWATMMDDFLGDDDDEDEEGGDDDDDDDDDEDSDETYEDEEDDTDDSWDSDASSEDSDGDDGEDDDDDVSDASDDDDSDSSGDARKKKKHKAEKSSKKSKRH